jgi:regulator of replication initiation timing
MISSEYIADLLNKICDLKSRISSLEGENEGLRIDLDNAEEELSRHNHDYENLEEKNIKYESLNGLEGAIQDLFRVCPPENPLYGEIRRIWFRWCEYK